MSYFADEQNTNDNKIVDTTSLKKKLAAYRSRFSAGKKGVRRMPGAHPSGFVAFSDKTHIFFDVSGSHQAAEDFKDYREARRGLRTWSFVAAFMAVWMTLVILSGNGPFALLFWGGITAFTFYKANSKLGEVKEGESQFVTLVTTSDNPAVKEGVIEDEQPEAARRLAETLYAYTQESNHPAAIANAMNGLKEDSSVENLHMISDQLDL